MKKAAQIFSKKSYERPTIKAEAWNFAKCQQEESAACYLYEYSLECEEIRKEVTALRERIAWKKAHDMEIRAWLEANPCPKSASEQSEWSKAALQKYPNMVAWTLLNSTLHFLAGCEEFPRKHWLELSATQRIKLGKGCHSRLRWELGNPSFRANSPIIFQPLEDFVEGWLDGWNNPQRGKLPSESGDYVFSFDWARSNRSLIEDFRKFLVKHRPNDQPPLESTRNAPSRKATHKELLKALGALRLIRACKDNAGAAHEYSDSVTGSLLFKDESAWHKAKRKARAEIATFEKQMLISPLNFAQ